MDSIQSRRKMNKQLFGQANTVLDNQINSENHLNSDRKIFQKGHRFKRKTSCFLSKMNQEFQIN